MSDWRTATSSQALTEEEKRIAISQVTAYDHFAAVSDQNRWLSDTPTSRAIVCVPPRSVGGQDRWVAVDPLSEAIDMNIEQPDADRTAMYACENNYGMRCYYYVDQLPCCIAWAIVASVIFSILTSPLILLCCIPMIYKMVEAKRRFEDGNPTDARKDYKSCCCWCIGPTVWISSILPFVITGIILVVVFAAVGIIR